MSENLIPHPRLDAIKEVLEENGCYPFIHYDEDEEPKPHLYVPLGYELDGETLNFTLEFYCYKNSDKHARLVMNMWPKSEDGRWRGHVNGLYFPSIVGMCNEINSVDGFTLCVDSDYDILQLNYSLWAKCSEDTPEIYRSLAQEFIDKDLFITMMDSLTTKIKYLCDEFGENWKALRDEEETEEGNS